MPRELITVQVGQAGNQIGREFWKRTLSEHAARSEDAVYDESMSAFFRNVDARYDPPQDIPLGDGSTAIGSLRARAILVDMDDGPVAETLRGPIGELFDHSQFVTDVSGAGNNFGHGFGVYGPQYREQLVDVTRRNLEKCDSPQSFFVMHSIGGGTGSGLGSYILGMLEEEFPEMYRFDSAVFPSEDDDVVTSPYNAMLALSHLTAHADCVLPLENQQLTSIVRAHYGKDRAGSGASAAAGARGARAARAEGFARMNDVAGRVLSDLTASLRFPGDLNVDLNEITTNLVPFPRMHFLTSSLSPLGLASRPGGAPSSVRSTTQMFRDVFLEQNQLISGNVRGSTLLACGLFARGSLTVSDLNREVAGLQKNLAFAEWNHEGFKTGLCSVAPAESDKSLLALCNSCAVRHTFAKMRDRFDTLWRRKAMVHHYAKFIEEAAFVDARESISDVIQLYEDADAGVNRRRLEMPLVRAAF